MINEKLLDKLRVEDKLQDYIWQQLWTERFSTDRDNIKKTGPTSLQPGLSSSSMLLAWRGCPAFTGISTTLSPTTTLNPIRGNHIPAGDTGWLTSSSVQMDQTERKKVSMQGVYLRSANIPIFKKCATGWASHEKQVFSYRGECTWTQHTETVAEKYTEWYGVIACITHAL